jgi:hypothetical protein
MSRITHTTPGALAEAATRHPHHQHVLNLANELKRIGTWLTHPTLNGLPSLVHYVEAAFVVGALALLLVVAKRIIRAILRRRTADAAACFRIVLPESFDRQALVGFFRSLTSLLRPHLIGASASVAFTLATDGQQLEIELRCSHGIAPQVRSALSAAVEGVSIEPSARIEQSELRRPRPVRCVLRPLVSRWLPFETKHESDPARAVLAALKGLSENEGSAVQLVFSPADRRSRRLARRQAYVLRTGRRSGVWRSLGRFSLELANEGLDLFTPGPSSSPGSSQTHAAAVGDSWAQEQATAIERKTVEPLLSCSIRLVAWANERRWARARLSGLVASFAQFHKLAGLERGHEFFTSWRFARRLPSPKPPLTVTAAEAAALLPLPVDAAGSPVVLPEPSARKLAPVAEASRQGVLVGRSDRDGFATDVRIDTEALASHLHVLGPTGRGKTTLLCNLYLEAAGLGLGAAYIEPKGDAIPAIVLRVSAERAEDVVLLDFGNELHPPALNLLACSPGDEDVHVEALVGIFRRLFGRFWGPRSEDILRSALATLLANRDPELPAPTLADVQALLTDPAEKARYPVTSDPVALAHFWRHWRALSESQREQALAPLSNKLRAFLGRRALRNVLCQEEAPDFEEIVAQGKLLLVALPSRTLGDAADLIGSVIVYRLWQAAQRLGPDSGRRPFLCLVDEAHRFCRLPQGLAQALAEARGYRLGFCLAHQHLAQLVDDDLADAVEANCQSKLCFALPPHDARRMAGQFAPRLDEGDLRHLGRYRIACRISQEGRQLPAATALTPPLPEPESGEAAELITALARGRAIRRELVERMIAARYGRPDPEEGGGGSPAPDVRPPSGPPSGPPPNGGPVNAADAHDSGESGVDGNPDKDEDDRNDGNERGWRAA